MLSSRASGVPWEAEYAVVSALFRVEPVPVRPRNRVPNKDQVIAL